ncbi:MAG: ATP-dependent RecD-like DNA helicase [Deltaproteobacteria bacterium]|nr:ATP-dependent RecD-like DNA helicase [Deltaproteobacteria bacterium]
MTKEVAVEGEVERVTFENRDTGFRVVKIAVDGRKERLAIVGTFPQVAVGARVRARGTIEVDRNHGEQLRVTHVTELAPTTLTGIEKYLGSGMIKGIGATFASRIVETFGLDTFKVLDEQPDRLRDVPGLGRTRAEQLAKAWQEQRAIRDVMVFLQAYGASPHLAARIYKRYGNKAVAIVSANPYRLAIDVWGVGFKTADRIASQMGIGHDSLERMQAALLQALRDATDSGHCYVVSEDLVSRAARLLAADATELEMPSPELVARLEEALQATVRSEYVIAEREGSMAREYGTSLRGAAVYDPKMHAAETRLAARLAALSRAEGESLPGFAEAVFAFEKEAKTSLAEEQRQAVESAARCPLLVVTGGPGVGKTTIVKAILSVFDRAHITTRLAAPTGRAAKRMSEATGREAMTLHRLLEFEPKTGGFKRDAKNPIEAGAIIVDESSMVDVWMADALAQAVGEGTRLILVGDVDQLPSVGPGSVLRDAIVSGVVPCVRLVRIFRQAEKSLIVQNAHRINGYVAPILPEPGDTASDFFMIEKRDPEEARKIILELVTNRIPKRFGLDPVRDIQVLTPMNRGPAGTMMLNEELQAALNPPSPSRPSIVRGKTTYRVGDKVMQLKNDYDRNVWNGDVGVVASVDPEEDALVVRFDEAGAAEGRDVPYDAGALDELALAYACTIHKSQGSEYPAIVIPLLTTHFVMLSKNLLYTAVTRGKRLVVLVADPRALGLALKPPAPGDSARSDKGDRRATKLSERLRAAGG